ncbi:hypothetical protein BJX96DRAFT_35712 [Aspergillus floccosus]
MNKPLPEDAERLRRQIKEMIPQTRSRNTHAPTASVLGIDREGSTAYGGEELGKLVNPLVKTIVTEEGWGWNVGHIPKSQPVINVNGRMYIVPLSDNATISPGGAIKEGSYTYITDSPSLSSNATAIFITPYKRPA